jgi:hypothetical protein
MATGQGQREVNGLSQLCLFGWGDRHAHGAARPIVVDLKRGKRLLPRNSLRLVKLFAGKVYNKQACLCAYIVTISTTYFYELKCVDIAGIRNKT